MFKGLGNKSKRTRWGLALLFVGNLPACQLLFELDGVAVVESCETNGGVDCDGAGGQGGGSAGEAGGADGGSVASVQASSGGAVVAVVSTSANSSSGSGVRLPPGCGDGILSETEHCDDGNLDALDGCGTDCRLEDNLNNCVATVPFELQAGNTTSWASRIGTQSPTIFDWACKKQTARASFASLRFSFTGNVRIEVVAQFDATLWLSDGTCADSSAGAETVCGEFPQGSQNATGAITVKVQAGQQRLLRVLGPPAAAGAYVIRVSEVP